ncbi:MAG: RES family NAD+ phosphorylase [bacterium]|nr:RES family NAD+ phosphorylase [bacterium]MDE0601509.1 RES family NAD+ phosphorylase [bacterium]
MAQAPPRSLAATGYRNQTPGYEVRSGEGARRFGGRFNPPDSFPVLYLCTTRRCASAELKRNAYRQRVPLDQILPRELWRIDVEVGRVLDLTDLFTRDQLGIEWQDLIPDEYRLTRAIGEAAYEQQFQAVLTPSATGVDNVVAVFPENLGGSVLRVQLVEVWKTSGDLP